ncbi:MAG: ribosome biogenesis GTPase Der [Aquificota bacterium]|nr:MAG: ribosome biogenesis GTPase Der [Aquificota bacterium]
MASLNLENAGAYVLIVGRPNVGKSTLFNRLVKRKKSIVHDMPGVTRDVIEERVSWRGVSFIVADTGGVLEEVDQITQAVKKQVERALKKAKVILFMVDGREGLTAGDEYVANLLYPYKDKVILVVNKIDSPSMESKAYEFYSLGFERVFFISAQHGKGVGELLDEVVKLLPKEGLEESPPEGVRIAFVGRPNVGKSSLINALLGDERVIVSPVPGTTRESVEVPFSYKGESFVLIDTAGMRRRSKVEHGVEFFSVGRAIRAVELSDISCLVIDLSEGVVHQDKTVGGLIERRYKGCVIVGNKVDLVKANKKEIEAYIRKELYFLHYAPIVLTSAVRSVGMTELLDACLLVWQDYNKQHKTSFVNRAVQKVLSERKPPTYKGKEVKVYYAFQEGTKPPTFVVFTNDPELWRSEYKKFFERRLMEYLGIKHSPIKLILKGREDGSGG